jgi:hypothetical protein
MAELAPQVISRAASVPQEFMPRAGQDPGRNAAIHEKRRRKEKRSAAAIEAQKVQNHDQIMAHWNIQHVQEQTRQRQVREELDCQKKKAEAWKEASWREHLEREAQRMQDDMRRDQVEQQRLQDEMRRAQLDKHTQSSRKVGQGEFHLLIPLLASHYLP